MWANQRSICLFFPRFVNLFLVCQSIQSKGKQADSKSRLLPVEILKFRPFIFESFMSNQMWKKYLFYFTSMTLSVLWIEKERKNFFQNQTTSVKSIMLLFLAMSILWHLLFFSRAQTWIRRNYNSILWQTLCQKHGIFCTRNSLCHRNLGTDLNVRFSYENQISCQNFIFSFLGLGLV